MKYKIVEIFDSIDGEGKRTGLPVSFIRLAGCNLRCSYCDTLYALFGEAEPCEYTPMDQEEILEQINSRFMRVTLTGGEPLLSPGIEDLVQALLDKGYEINIETNGAVDICEFLNRIKPRENLFFTIDYKLPTSGMLDKMIWQNFLHLTHEDVIKFVVGSKEDVVCMLDVVQKLKSAYTRMPQIYIGAVYGAFGMKELVELIMSEPLLSDAHFQIQLHKIVWNPDERGV